MLQVALHSVNFPMVPQKHVTQPLHAIGRKNVLNMHQRNGLIYVVHRDTLSMIKNTK